MRTREEDRIYQKQHRLRNPKVHNDKMNHYSKRVRGIVLGLLGNKCYRCGFSDVRALQIDHVNGGGAKELKTLGGVGYWNNVIKSVINEEGRYQLLCANCNWIKRYENNEVRKKRIYDK